MRTRKRYDRLTSEERLRFVHALLVLKDDGRYDQHVRIYQRVTCWARRGPAFLPWHRHFLLRFEEDLRSAEPDVTLPYWDFCGDRSTQSSLWDEDFMGGDGRPHDGMVITGPFATEAGAWPLVHGGFLVRRLGRDPVASSLPTVEDLEHVLNDARYDVAPWDSSSPAGFRNRIEGWVRGPALHNRVHAWVGGVMARDDAPDDPLFWLVHAFIDKLWSDWQRRHPGAEYQPAGEGPRGHNLDDAMWPWNGGHEPEIVAPFHEAPLTVRPRDLLDHRALGYAYDDDADDDAELGSDGGEMHTTLAVGEEEPTFGFGEEMATTLAVGEEAPQPTTRAIGEEGPQLTTLAVGEESPPATTQAIGEEEPPRYTTLAVGEEEPPRYTTLAVGEEGPQLTTLAVGEEGPQLTTLAVGEEGPAPDPSQDRVGASRMTTLAVGEEEPSRRLTTQAIGEEDPARYTTLAIGEEEPPRYTTQAVGEEEPFGTIPTTQALGEEGPLPSTDVLGEEGPYPTTQALGEEDRVTGRNPGMATTLAIGEEDARMTTLAVGEESPRPTTLRLGEEDPPPTTAATGEEDTRATTLATGEEEPTPTTLATGEEDPSSRGGPFGRY